MAIAAFFTRAAPGSLAATVKAASEVQKASSGSALVSGPAAFAALRLVLTPLALSLLASPLALSLLASPQATAQTYIDVEAERRAAQANPPVYGNLSGSQPGSTSGSYLGNQSGNPPSSGGAVSYGAGSAPTGVTRSLPPPAAPGSDNIGGLFNQVQQLQQEVMRLNGLVEQQAYELRLLKEQSLERYVDLDSRLAGGAVAAGGAGASAAGAGSGTGGTTQNAGVSAGGVSGASGTSARPAQNVAEQPGEGDAYRAAYALVRGQQFDEAVSAFSRFIQTYPDGRYAPNAHYWMGELYLVIDPTDPEAARQSFMLLLNQYPTHSKIPDAIYKLGRVHYIKGNNRVAREYLDRVVREYPKSSAARLASDFIDQNL